LPPKIKRHRPDLIGIKKDTLVIGEAKTAGDICLRTREQIEDYVACSNNIKGKSLSIYIGVPISIKGDIENIVEKVNGEKVVTIFTVPDRLLPI